MSRPPRVSSVFPYTTLLKAEWIDGLAEGKLGFAFGITEPEHGSDATYMETHAERDGDGWVINGCKTWNTGIHKAPYDLIFARTSGKPGDGRGITAFLVPMKSEGVKVNEMLGTCQDSYRPRHRVLDQCQGKRRCHFWR